MTPATQASIALFLAAIVWPVGAQEVPAADVRRALDARRAAFEQAIAANDVGGMVQLYTPDALLFAPSGDTLRGREAIRRAFDHERDYTISHDIVELDVTGDAAYEIGRWKQIRKDDRAEQGGGWYFWVWRRQSDGEWLVHRDLWSSFSTNGN